VYITTVKYSVKKTVTFSQPIITVYASVVCVYISCTRLSSCLQYKSQFVVLGGWGVREVSKKKNWL